DGVLQESDTHNFVYETQRLMAFLDSTTRSYGSADILVDMDCYQNCQAESRLNRFFKTWMNAAMELSPDDRLTQVFSSTALKNLVNARGKTSSKEFPCLELPLKPAHETLYDVLDTVIWVDKADQPLEDVWIEHVAPIFTVR